MLLVSHLLVGSTVLDKIQNQTNWKINKLFYMLGNVAPDLNCIFPSHAIDTTLRKFKKHIRRIQIGNSTIIKSFTLGMVLHYICDYFCFAHNIHAHGPKHSIYELQLEKHVKSNRLSQNTTDLNNISNEWQKIKDKIKSQNNINMSDIDNLIEMIIQMNKQYMYKINQDEKFKETFKNVSLDLSYSLFMTLQVACELT